MSGEERKRLGAAMAGNRPPIPFVGAGFSSAVTGDDPCATWHGLLLNGIDACADKAPALPKDWADHRKAMLSEKTTDSYILVADEIRKYLGPVRDGWEFRSWLEGTVGSLQPKGEGQKLIAAVRALGKMAVTTNYDTLIEQAEPNWNSASLTGSGYEVTDLAEESVLHLHGVFANPDSVILGNADYQQLNDAELQDMLSKWLFARYRFIFIGCGAGLADPHIGPLIKFIERVVPKQGPENFILIKNDEIRQYNDRPLSQKITPVGYGDGYEELLPFLRSLAPKQDAVGVAASSAKQQSAASSETGLVAHGKLAEQKLRDARSLLDRVGDAMEDVQRNLPAPAMEDWSFEKQEAEHGKRAAALLGSAQQLENCSKGALGEFRAVEDEVSQLIEPRFASYVSRLGKIAKETTDLESDAARLLIRAAEARDEVGGRIGEYDGYRVIYETLSRAHAAIEQARGTATRLQAALAGLALGSEPRRVEQARRPARSAEPEGPSPQQRDAARSEAAWRVPIAGSAAAGTGNMPAEGEDEFLLIPPPRNALKRNVLAVRVDGDSMTGDDMLDGDYVIIDKARREPRQGEIAVVRIGPSVHADMVVKHVWREEDGLLLKPSDAETHDSRKVFWNEEPSVEGLVIGVFRPASYRPLSN